MSNNFSGVMNAYHNLVETLRDARRLHHRSPNAETFNLWKRMIRKVEHLENKIIDLKLRADGNKGPRNWREADDMQESLLFFDLSMTQLLENPGEEHLDMQVGMGVRSMGQVSATVGGATYRFSTVLEFDQYDPDVYKYHTLMTLDGEQIMEREGTDYKYAANYGEMLDQWHCNPKNSTERV